MAIKAEVKGKKMLLEVDLDGTEPSKTGKSIIVASTAGWAEVGEYGISLNIVRKIQKRSTVQVVTK